MVYGNGGKDSLTPQSPMRGVLWEAAALTSIANPMSSSSVSCLGEWLRYFPLELMLQACNGHSIVCVPLYDTLGMIQTFSVIVAFLRLTTAHVLWTEVVYAYLSWQVELWIGTLHLSIVGCVQAVNHMSVFCVVCGLQVWMLWSLLLIMQRLPLHLCKSLSFPRYAKDDLVLNILCDHLFLVIALLPCSSAYGKFEQCYTFKSAQEQTTRLGSWDAYILDLPRKSFYLVVFWGI